MSGIMYNFSLKNEFYKLICDEKISSFEKTLELYSPANSTAAFQVIVPNDENIAINVGTNDWFSHNSDVTVLRFEYSGMFSCEMNIIGYITDDDGKEKADILLKNDTEEFIGKNGSVYCEINIPKNAMNGDYEGEIKIYAKKLFAPETLVETLKVKLHVAKFILPDVRARNFHLDLWQNPYAVARYHGVELWSEEHFEVMRPLMTLLADAGQKVIIKS